MRKYLYFTFALAGLFLLKGQVALATEWTTEFQDTGSTEWASGYTEYTPQQTFKVSSNQFVSRIELEMYRVGSLMDLTLRLCKRASATSTLSRYCAAPDTLIKETTGLASSIGTSTYTWFNWPINATTTAGYYSIVIDGQSSPSNYLRNYYKSTADSYANGGMYRIITNTAVNYDLNFRVWYSNDYPSSSTPQSEPYQHGQMDYVMHQYPYVYLNNEYYCNVGVPCQIDFTHNGYANGHEIWFYRASTTGDSVPVPPALASTTLGLYAYGTSTISIPYTAGWDGLRVPMCAWIHDPFGYDIDRLQCGWEIWWFTESQKDWINGITNCDGSYDINSACNTVSTSSGSYADDFRYGIECAGRKTAYWLFTRSDASCTNLFKVMNSLNSKFPFNVYNQVKDNAYELANLANTATSSNFRIPLMLWQKNTGTLYDSGIDLFNYHIIASSSVGSVWSNMNDGLTKFIYFLGFIWFMTELVGISMPDMGESHEDINSHNTYPINRSNAKPVPSTVPAFMRNKKYAKTNYKYRNS